MTFIYIWEDLEPKRGPLTKKECAEIDARVEREHREFMDSLDYGGYGCYGAGYGARKRRSDEGSFHPLVYIGLGAILAMAFCSDANGATSETYSPQETHTIESVLE